MTLREIMARHGIEPINVGAILNADDALTAELLKVTEIVRQRDPSAKYLQLMHLTGRELVSDFWRERFTLKTLQSIWHTSDDPGELTLSGVGPFFSSIHTDKFSAQCIAPIDALAPFKTAGAFRKRYVHDLGPLNTIVEWAHKHFSKNK